jgi:hypothetical protein
MELYGMTYKGLTVVLMGLMLTACGSDSDSDSSPKTVTQNVVLTSNGAEITASYNEVSTDYIGDGDTTTSTFWAGNVDGDNFVVDFGQVAQLTNITIYTNTTSYSSSDPAIQVELSEDNATWETTMQPFGSPDIACPTWSAGSGKLSCTFAAEESARYMRVTTNDSGVHIYEVEATGTVSTN